MKEYPEIMTCRCCNEDKPAESFPLIKEGRYRSYICRQCTTANSILNRLKQIEKNGTKTVSRKKCPRCGKTKSARCFYKSSYQTDGLSSYCKVCGRAYSRERDKAKRGL